MIYSDTELAKLLCDGDTNAKKAFQKHYKIDLWKVASWRLYVPHKEEKLDKLLKFKGSDIQFKVTPDTTKAYAWLSEQMALKACKYKGLVPFKNYIRSVMWKRTTTIDWLRHHKGSTQIIPRKIIEQGKLFEDITRLKLKDKFKDDICNKLDCLPVEFDRVMANEHVMKFLKKRNKYGEDRIIKADAFHQPNIVDTMVGEGKESKEFDHADKSGIIAGGMIEKPIYESDQQLFLEEAKNKIKEVINECLSSKERGILKVVISKRRSIEELIKDTKSDNIDLLGITSEKEYDKFYKKCENNFRDEIRKIYKNLDRETIKHFFYENFI